MDAEPLTRRPMLNVDLAHGEVADVRSRQRGSDADRGGGDQAVRLVKRDAAPSERATPPARMPSATPSGARRRPLNSRRACRSSPSRSPRQISSTETTQAQGSVPERPQAGNALRGSVSTKRVDEHRRIQQHAGHRQPERRWSPRRCCRTHAAGSSSQSWPVSGRLPSAAWISSQRRSSSSPRSINAAMKALRRPAPARRSSSATRASSNAVCIRMGLR